MNRYGFVRITAASLKTSVADPAANASEIVHVLSKVADSDIVVFPELCVTGYTCGDLFGQTALLDAAFTAIETIARATAGRKQLIVVGSPISVDVGLYNSAVAISDGNILGIVPKQYMPTYKEFYEGRWFQPAMGSERAEVELADQVIPFGTDLLFEAAEGTVVVGIEICEDLWVAIPPSSHLAASGATILLNPSASNETIGKSAYRRDLVVGQSGRCIAAYAYAGSGPSESTTDVVFGGHCLIAENGRLIVESSRVGDGHPVRRDSYWITADVDVELLARDRRAMNTFGFAMARGAGGCRRVPFALEPDMPGLKRTISGSPFVPAEGPELHRRCAEIFGIQCAGLAKRIERLPAGTSLNIGISGGLDSTLAILVAVKTCDMLGLDRGTIHGLTMPGFGTTSKTLANAKALMEQLGVSSETIDISNLALDTFRELKHKPFGIDPFGIDLDTFRAALAKVPRERRHDLVFENVQARLRTFLLMSRGFVIGTGDMSELALGWATYNGDHMSMYNPNCSIPKTLVKFLVRYVAQDEMPEGPARDTLMSIFGTTISPELLPFSQSGEIEQSTEAMLGPYELHDFILYQAVRCGHSPEKIRFLAEHATFSERHELRAIDAALKTFFTRFFSQQFKRSCVPDGPKVGTVSLSPRGDWRMPSDAEPSAWVSG